MVYDCFSGASPLAKARQVCLHASVWRVWGEAHQG